MKQLRELIGELEVYELEIYRIKNIISVMYVDLQSVCPQSGKSERSEGLGYLTGLVHDKVTHPGFRECVKESISHPDFSTLEAHTQRKLQLWEKEMLEQSQLPKAFVETLEAKKHTTNTLWSQARSSGSEADKKLYIEALRELFELSREEYRYLRDIQSFACEYDYFLDKYEQGITSTVIDTEFETIKKAILGEMQNISKNPLRDEHLEILKNWNIPKSSEQKILAYIFELLGLTPDRFTSFETHHPFMICMGPSETRVGLSYRDDPLFALSSGSHEAGHAVYEANMHYKNTIVGEAPSLGLHESQSLFWESHIVSSKAFLQKLYPQIQALSDGYLDQVSLDDFYVYYNLITKSLIRIEGDELTYPLHIIIRYEIERDLFNGVISFDDLETVWNAKYQAYFGKTPSTSKEGFMQDIHWSEGMFGYFPTYLIGRIYASQIEGELRTRLPNFDELLATHDITPILDLLKKHIYQPASLQTTSKTILDFTGSSLDSSVYMSYLQKKYGEMYMS